MLSAANFPFIFNKYKTFQLDLLSQYQRGSRYLVRNLTFSGPVLCSQHPPVDHPRGEPRGVLPGDVGGAGERSRIQHRAAQHRRSPLQTIIGSLDQVLCPMYTCRNNPMQMSYN